MLIYIADFPSKGYGCPLSSVDLKQMSFKDMIEYNKYLSNTYIQKLYRDIKTLEKDIGPSIDQISFYDLDFLVYVKKSFSVNKQSDITVNLNCSHCGKSSKLNIKATNLVYTSLDDIVKKISEIKLGNKTYNIEFPNIGKVKKVMDNFMRYSVEVDPGIFLLLCCIKEYLLYPNQVQEDVEGAVADDILLLQHLQSVYNGCFKKCELMCPACRERSVITISDLMTDMFRLLRDNCKVDQSKIIFH